MKKVYRKPGGVIERFTPNDYVSACGDGGTNYLFKCDAGVDSYTYYVNYYGWKIPETTDHPYKVYRQDGTQITSPKGNYFGKCGETHKASTEDEFIRGYIDNAYTPQNEKIAVYIWTNGGTDIHCTTDLDKEHWQTDRS